jgi:hypothetical protein
MNVVGVVVIASPPRDLIWSKHHNGRHLQVLHMYSAATTPPPWSSKARWSGRWDQQHNGVVLMVENICGQGFAYAREVEEDMQKSSQTRAKRSYRKNTSVTARAEPIQSFAPVWCSPFYSGWKREMQDSLLGVHDDWSSDDLPGNLLEIATSACQSRHWPRWPRAERATPGPVGQLLAGPVGLPAAWPGRS